MTFCRHIFSYKNIIKIKKKIYIYPVASSNWRDRQAKSLVHESQPRVNDGAFYICVYRKGDCLMPESIIQVKPFSSRWSVNPAKPG